MTTGLAERDRHAAELMDDPACDRERLERTYELFPLVNAAIGGWGGVYRREIRPRARRGRVRILDVGCGGADVARALLRRARRDRLPVEIVAIDPDRRAIDWAARQPTVAGLGLHPVDTGALVAAGERFDLVLSNHVLHHLERDALDALLRDSARLLRRGGAALHRDIARGRLAYAGFATATALVPATHLRRSFIRADGLASIRRSYTRGELAAIAPSPWHVRVGFPARLELRLERDGR